VVVVELVDVVVEVVVDVVVEAVVDEVDVEDVVAVVSVVVVDDVVVVVLAVVVDEVVAVVVVVDEVVDDVVVVEVVAVEVVVLGAVLLVVVVVAGAGHATSTALRTLHTRASSRRSSPPAMPPKLVQYVSPPSIASTTVAESPGFGGTMSTGPSRPRRFALIVMVPIALCLIATDLA
jgi:hypothetical protein